MLRSCAYCGRIHDSKTACRESKKRKAAYSKDEKITKFRNSQAWKKQRRWIKDRDKNICICCHFDANAIKKFNSTDLEVHHINSLETDFDHRLDDNNLITLCRHHHELAEAGKISKEELKSMLQSTPQGMP